MRQFSFFTIITLSFLMTLVSCKEDDKPEPVVVVVDKNAPTITLNGDTLVMVTLNGDYDELGAEATDVKDGILTSNIQISGFVNTNLVGDYEKKYDARDSDGNNAETKVRLVKVRNDADRLEGVYSAVLKCSPTSADGNFNTQISTSETVNNEFYFSYMKEVEGKVKATLNGVEMTIPVGFDSLNTRYSGNGFVFTDSLNFSFSTLRSLGQSANCRVALSLQ